jgi:hypothetical protein
MFNKNSEKPGFYEVFQAALVPRNCNFFLAINFATPLAPFHSRKQAFLPVSVKQRISAKHKWKQLAASNEQ